MIDARRMEVYTALYDINLKRVEQIEALIVSDLTYNESLKQKKYCFLEMVHQNVRW